MSSEKQQEQIHILEKIKSAGLVGRGGAEFPTYRKWEFVKAAKGKPKYVVCNASEGEIGLFKDIQILRDHPEQVFSGMKLAMDYLETKKGYFNMNARYYRELHEKLEDIIEEYAKEGYDIKVFREHPSYIGGEETALLNAIEGKRTKPRLKPPFPAQKGLFGKPTLVHNVETLFNIAAVENGTYDGSRFYCLSGEIKHPGVYHLPADWSSWKVLEATGNEPAFPYFIQIGGSASGEVLNSEQAKEHPVTGAGSIEVYRMSIKPKDLLLKWLEFYKEESCGKCTPCREGTYQLYHLVKDSARIPWKSITDILELLETSSFCALGKSVPIAIRSYAKNILNKPL